jgi:hypothetical protein
LLALLLAVSELKSLPHGKIREDFLGFCDRVFHTFGIGGQRESPPLQNSPVLSCNA